MSNLNLSLPDHLQQFAAAQARSAGFASAAEYIVSLLAREERKRGDMQQLEAALQEGIDSGATIEVNDHYWERKRHELLARHRAREAQQPSPAAPARTSTNAGPNRMGGKP